MSTMERQLSSQGPGSSDGHNLVESLVMVRRSLVKVKVRPAFASHSYCSNPDDDEFGVWCYTKDPNVRWEYCNVPKCDIQDTNSIGLVSNNITEIKGLPGPESIAFDSCILVS